MKKSVGIWIDHSDAYIVQVAPNGKGKSVHIKAHIEPNVKGTGGTDRLSNASGIQKHLSQRRIHEIGRLCQKVIEKIESGTDQIALFGPGSGKNELKRELLKNGDFGDKVVHVGAASKMTPPQVSALVHDYYKMGAPRLGKVAAN